MLRRSARAFSYKNKIHSLHTPTHTRTVAHAHRPFVAVMVVQSRAMPFCLFLFLFSTHGLSPCSLRHCNALPQRYSTLQHPATHCNALQQTATHYKTDRDSLFAQGTFHNSATVMYFLETRAGGWEKGGHIGGRTVARMRGRDGER